MASFTGKMTQETVKCGFGLVFIFNKCNSCLEMEQRMKNFTEVYRKGCPLIFLKVD